MSQYDTLDVKSVQKFLVAQKELFDKVNSKLPEDVEKLNYENFTNAFFKANEGILKNRDALKQEKLAVVEEFEEYKKKSEETRSSIDEKHKVEYNAIVQERDELKATMKNGNVDIDGINAKHLAELNQLKAESEQQIAAKTKELSEANKLLTSNVDRFKGMFFNKLKKETLSEQLERINVNPEDRALIVQANLSRAEIEEDAKGNYKVAFRVDDETTIDGAKFWDSWASNNQRYIKASDNTGGGAPGGAGAKPVSAKVKLVEQLKDPNISTVEWMKLNDQLATMD